MNAEITGTLFDAETLAGRPVRLTVHAGRIQSADDASSLDVPLADLQVSDRLGNLRRFLYFPRGITVETPDNDAVDLMLSRQRRGRLVALVHTLEQRHQVAAAATLLLVATIGLAIWWALPALARHVARSIPVALEEKAGKVSLATLQRVVAPSQLNRVERRQVEAMADRLADAAHIAERPKLVFISMGGKFPNAFALPGGIIVVSDELVRLSGHPDEIGAVLAHEIGHWQHRHGIQSVLRNSTALLVVSAVTGDLSTLTTFAGTIPFLLLQRGYAREFEAEADTYALDLMQRAGIDPRHFRSILRKLDTSRPAEGNDFTYLSTHPGTEERIRALGALPSEPPAAYVRTTEPGVTDPRALSRPSPHYPRKMRDARLQGSVTVEFVINEYGYTESLRIVRSTYQEFEEPALTAVRRWRFEPASKNGQAIPYLASQELQFSIDQPPPPANPEINPPPEPNP